MFTKLKQEHAQIRSISKLLDEILAAPFDAPLVEVGDARALLARAIHQHLVTENETLIRPLNDRRLTDDIPKYHDIMRLTRDLRLRYSQHVGQWTLSTIERDRSGYAIAARRLNAEMVAIMNREESEIFPAAEKLLAGRTIARTAGFGTASG
jgi:hypothetical protein